MFSVFLEWTRTAFDLRNYSPETELLRVSPETTLFVARFCARLVLGALDHAETLSEELDDGPRSWVMEVSELLARTEPRPWPRLALPWLLQPPISAISCERSVAFCHAWEATRELYKVAQAVGYQGENVELWLVYGSAALIQAVALGRAGEEYNISDVPPLVTWREVANRGIRLARTELVAMRRETREAEKAERAQQRRAKALSRKLAAEQQSAQRWKIVRK